jgi:glycosyltransferase involved in cell wall biosynthesis
MIQTFYRNGRLIKWKPKSPVVTCLMSVYNGESYLCEAIESILDQAFTNFEFIIINDGSTDDSLLIIEKFNDPRIRLVCNNENIGLTKSLNKGIELSNGKYIARIDADDISLPNRLSEQVDFMEKNSAIGMVCSKTLKINDSGQEIESHSHYTEHDIRFFLFLNNSIKHSSAFIRSDILERYGLSYEEKFKTSQDYRLWTKILLVSRIQEIDKYLVKIRQHDKAVSIIDSGDQQANARIIAKDYLHSVGLELDEYTHTRLMLYAIGVNNIASNYFLYRGLSRLVTEYKGVYSPKQQFIGDELQNNLYAKLSIFSRFKLLFNE